MIQVIDSPLEIKFYQHFCIIKINPFTSIGIVDKCPTYCFFLLHLAIKMSQIFHNSVLSISSCPRYFLISLKNTNFKFLDVILQTKITLIYISFTFNANEKRLQSKLRSLLNIKHVCLNSRYQKHRQ